MIMVQSRDAATLLPIIQRHVRPGSIVWSDEWAAYRRVQQLPSVAQHSTINHSIQFVDPTTGVHTQNIESYWNRVKTKFKRMKGVQDTMLSSYLDEFMWRERHGRTGSTALQNLCRDIALRYPVWKPWTPFILFNFDIHHICSTLTSHIYIHSQVTFISATFRIYSHFISYII